MTSRLLTLGALATTGAFLFLNRPTLDAATAIPPRPAFCAAMYSGGCSFGDHKLQGPAGDKKGEEAHGDCRTCIVGYPCHTDCNQSLWEEETRVAYQRVLEAAARGDVEAVLALADAADDYVEVNAPRGSVQVRSCDRSLVIANLNLPMVGDGESSGSAHPPSSR